MNKDVRIFLFTQSDNDTLYQLIEDVTFVQDDGLFVDVTEAQIQDAPQAAQSLEIEDLPTVVFTIHENGVDYPVARLIGNQINAENLENIMNQLRGLQSLGNGEFSTTSGIIVGNDKELSLGFGLFDLFNFKIPPFAWLIVAAASGIKAGTSKKPTCQAVFGSITVLSLYKYFKSR